MATSKRYLLVLAATAILGSLPMLANLAFLNKAGEIWPFVRIVAFQQEHDALYGSGLVNNIFRYKLELIRQRKPDILVLGSSKVGFFQEEAFTHRFVNASGGMHHFNEALLFLREAFKFHQPKVLIFGVDYFLFNGNHAEQTEYPEHDWVESDLTRQKLLAPFDWLTSKKITLQRYIDIASGRSLSNPYTTYPSLGIAALQKGSAFRRDGSRIEAKRFAGVDDDFLDRKFAFAFSNLEKRCCEFESGKDLDPARLREFEEILELCRSNGVALVLYMTPVSSAILDTMKKTPADFGYLSTVEQRVGTIAKERGVEFYDFLDLRTIGASDCECTDATHAGAIAHYRMLNWILEHNPKTVLGPYLNQTVIHQMVSDYSGRAFVVLDKSKLSFDEKDFLEIGCHKAEGVHHE